MIDGRGLRIGLGREVAVESHCYSSSYHLPFYPFLLPGGESHHRHPPDSALLDRHEMSIL